MPDITAPAATEVDDNRSVAGRDYGTWTDADGRSVPLRLAGPAGGRAGWAQRLVPRFVPRFVPRWAIGWQGLLTYPLGTVLAVAAYVEFGWLWIAGTAIALGCVSAGQVAVLLYVVRRGWAPRVRRQRYRAIAATMGVWCDVSIVWSLMFSWIVLPEQLSGPSVVLRIGLLIMMAGTIFDVQVARTARRPQPR
jgi:hypothetical protein